MDYVDICRIHRALVEAKRSAALAQALAEQAKNASAAAEDFIRIADSLLAAVQPS